MSEATLAAEAAPIVGDVVKALTPEAESLLKAAEAHLVAEAEHLKAEIDDSHNKVIEWLRGQFGAPVTAPEVPTPAPPAAPAPTA